LKDKKYKCIKLPLFANNMYKTYWQGVNFFEHKQNIKNKWSAIRQKATRKSLAKNSIRAQSSKQIKQRNIPSTTNARKLQSNTEKYMTY